MAGLLTPSEVADRWACSVGHVQRLCRAGELGAMRLGRRGWRISAEAIAAYEQRQTPPLPPRREEGRIVTAVAGLALPADYRPLFPELWNGSTPTKKAPVSSH